MAIKGIAVFGQPTPQEPQSTLRDPERDVSIIFEVLTLCFCVLLH